MHDDARSQALQAYDILHSAREPLFDAVTELTAYLFSVPVARVAFVAADHVWHKASAGMEAQETLPSDQSLCARAVRQPAAVLVYEDLTAAAEPAPDLMRARQVHFYAGALLRSPAGQAVGTLCVAGYEPRTFGPAEHHALARLAGLVVSALEARRRLRPQGEDTWLAARTHAEEALQQHMTLVRYLKARTAEQVPVPLEVLDLVCARVADVSRILDSA